MGFPRTHREGGSRRGRRQPPGETSRCHPGPMGVPASIRKSISPLDHEAAGRLATSRPSRGSGPRSRASALGWIPLCRFRGPCRGGRRRGGSAPRVGRRCGHPRARGNGGFRSRDHALQHLQSVQLPGVRREGPHVCHAGLPSTRCLEAGIHSREEPDIRAWGLRPARPIRWIMSSKGSGLRSRKPPADPPGIRLERRPLFSGARDRPGERCGLLGNAGGCAKGMRVQRGLRRWQTTEPAS